MADRLSILYPPDVEKEEYHQIPEETWHDLGMDLIIREISNQENDRIILKNVMSSMTKNPKTAKFRSDVFADILSHPDLLENVIRILKEVDQLQDFMARKNNISNMDGVWTLSRRLKEVHEYILCIEELDKCLSGEELTSEGLRFLQTEMKRIRSEREFQTLKKDIEDLRLETKKVKSVTLGINLSEYMDAKSVGIVSLNDKAFSTPGILKNFTKKIFKADRVQAGNDWNDNYTYETIPEESKISIHTGSVGMRSIAAAANPLMGLAMNGSMAGVAADSKEVNLMEYLNEVANSMLAVSVKRLKEVLSGYGTVDISSITSLIPEFNYYSLWAQYILTLKKEGYRFCKATVLNDDGIAMKALDIYNLKLAAIGKIPPEQIAGNDLFFDKDHNLYILTGANRGGKTTITQAIGQLYLLAQGGIFVPGDEFSYVPADLVFTHFPADEDKTMDFGRLGEECNRFRNIYKQSTKYSLMLLNESFSTTSFEEGYFIAVDAIRALLHKGVRTIFNTHMHKLARNIEKINASSDRFKSASLIVEAENGNRSYKVKVAPAEGASLADDIAKKYGVTYEQLTEVNEIFTE